MYIAQQQLTCTDSFYACLRCIALPTETHANRFWQCKVVAQQHHSTYSAHSLSTSYVQTKTLTYHQTKTPWKRPWHGSWKYPFCWGDQPMECMVNLRNFPLIVDLFGLVSFNDPYIVPLSVLPIKSPRFRCWASLAGQTSCCWGGLEESFCWLPIIYLIRVGLQIDTHVYLEMHDRCICINMCTHVVLSISFLALSF